jgi:Peptidase propeptide and YPEB domain
LKVKKKPERNSANPQSLNAREAVMSKLMSVILGVLSVAPQNVARSDQPGLDWMSAQQVIEKALNLGYMKVTELKADDGRWEGEGIKSGPEDGISRRS